MTSDIIAGTRKCTYCRTTTVLKEDTWMWYNNVYYHNKCYLQFIEKSTEKSLKGIDPKQEIEDKKRLLEYISQFFDEDYMNQKLSIDLAGLLRKKFTYQGILYSLIYYIEVKRQKLTLEYGISTVNLIYNEARKYYDQLHDNKEKIDSQRILKNDTKTVFTTIISSFKKNIIDLKTL